MYYDKYKLHQYVSMLLLCVNITCILSEGTVTNASKLLQFSHDMLSEILDITQKILRRISRKFRVCFSIKCNDIAQKSIFLCL